MADQDALLKSLLARIASQAANNGTSHSRLSLLPFPADFQQGVAVIDIAEHVQQFFRTSNADITVNSALLNSLLLSLLDQPGARLVLPSDALRTFNSRGVLSSQSTISTAPAQPSCTLPSAITSTGQPSISSAANHIAPASSTHLQPGSLPLNSDSICIPPAGPSQASARLNQNDASSGSTESKVADAYSTLPPPHVSNIGTREQAVHFEQNDLPDHGPKIQNSAVLKAPRTETSRTNPGFYIDQSLRPQTSTRGRPKKFLIGVIKTDRLFSLDWFRQSTLKRKIEEDASSRPSKTRRRASNAFVPYEIGNESASDTPHNRPAKRRANKTPLRMNLNLDQQRALEENVPHNVVGVCQEMGSYSGQHDTFEQIDHMRKWEAKHAEDLIGSRELAQTRFFNFTIESDVSAKIPWHAFDPELYYESDSVRPQGARRQSSQHSISHKTSPYTSPAAEQARNRIPLQTFNYSQNGSIDHQSLPTETSSADFGTTLAATPPVSTGPQAISDVTQNVRKRKASETDTDDPSSKRPDLMHESSPAVPSSVYSFGIPYSEKAAHAVSGIVKDRGGLAPNDTFPSTPATSGPLPAHSIFNAQDVNTSVTSHQYRLDLPTGTSTSAASATQPDHAVVATKQSTTPSSIIPSSEANQSSSLLEASGQHRSKKTSETAKAAFQEDVSQDTSESSNKEQRKGPWVIYTSISRPFKARRAAFDQQSVDIVLSALLIRLVSGGERGTINWGIHRMIWSGSPIDKAEAFRRYDAARRNEPAIVEDLYTRLSAAYLSACGDGTLPVVKVNNYAAYDWIYVFDWVRRNVNTSKLLKIFAARQTSQKDTDCMNKMVSDRPAKTTAMEISPFPNAAIMNDKSGATTSHVPTTPRVQDIASSRNDMLSPALQSEPFPTQAKPSTEMSASPVMQSPLTNTQPGLPHQPSFVRNTSLRKGPTLLPRPAVLLPQVSQASQRTALFGFRHNLPNKLTQWHSASFSTPLTWPSSSSLKRSYPAPSPSVPFRSSEELACAAHLRSICLTPPELRQNPAMIDIDLKSYPRSVLDKSFEIFASSGFVTKPKRTLLKAHHLQLSAKATRLFEAGLKPSRVLADACRAKRTIDEAFLAKGFISVQEGATDGLALCTLNMLGSDTVSLEMDLPERHLGKENYLPVTDDDDMSDPFIEDVPIDDKGNILSFDQIEQLKMSGSKNAGIEPYKTAKMRRVLSQFGLDNSIRHNKKIDRKAFAFTVTIRPLEGYQHGLPAYSDRARLPIQTNKSEPFRPFWIDSCGRLSASIVDSVVGVILSLLTIKPTATCAEMQDRFDGLIHAWEMKRCLQWLQECGVIQESEPESLWESLQVSGTEKQGDSRWKLKEWWWTAFGHEGLMWDSPPGQVAAQRKSAADADSTYSAQELEQDEVDGND